MVYWQTQESGQLFPYQGAYDALALFLVWFQDHVVSHVFLLASLALITGELFLRFVKLLLLVRELDT